MDNVIIVGGGPAGYSAAIYLARAGLSPLVVEGTTGGGQLAQTTEVENYPGFPDGIMGPELIMNFRKQAERFDTRFVTENVSKVTANPLREASSQTPANNNRKSENPSLILPSKGRSESYSSSSPPLLGEGRVGLGFNIQTTNGKVYESKSVLIATGADAMWLGLPSEQRLRGKGVSACATCDGFFFRNKIVAVVGGGDTALEEALTLTKFATKVYLIHRRNEFRASKIMVERAQQNPKIEIIFNAEVVEVMGENKVEGLQIKKIAPLLNGYIATKNNITIEQFNNETIKLDGLFVAIGHKPATGFLDGSGVLLDQKGYVITSESEALKIAKLLNGQIVKNNRAIEQFNNETIKQYNLDYQYATSVSGIFAAGDCVDHVYRQAGTAVGMGIAAALEIQNFLEENSEE